VFHFQFFSTVVSCVIALLRPLEVLIVIHFQFFHHCMCRCFLLCLVSTGYSICSVPLCFMCCVNNLELQYEITLWIVLDLLCGLINNI